MEWERVRVAILCIFVEEEEQSLNVEGGASLSGASEDVPKTGKFAFS
jgi:hypothetical protein